MRNSNSKNQLNCAYFYVQPQFIQQMARCSIAAIVQSRVLDAVQIAHHAGIDSTVDEEFSIELAPYHGMLQETDSIMQDLLLSPSSHIG